MSTEATEDRPPIIELRGVSKHFGGVRALEDVSMYVRPGEVVGLVGDNGAGKSTLVKTMSGLQPADRGSVLCDGNEVALATVQDAHAMGIQTVYQDLALCNNLDTVQNLFLNREIRLPWWRGNLLAHARMEKRAKELLGDLGVKIRDLRVPIGGLSGGQRQGVAVARSLLSDPKLVILDEPTAALGIAQRHEIIELIKRLRNQGRGVVLVSHDLLDVVEVADRVVVMRLGRKAADLDEGEVTHAAMVHHITGGLGVAQSTEFSPKRKAQL